MPGNASGSFLPLEGLGGTKTNYGVSGTTNRMPALAGTGMVYQHFSAAMTAPMQTMTIAIRMGDSFSAALTAPMATARGFGGGTAKLTAPLAVVSGHVDVALLARAELTAPNPVVYGHVLTGAGWRVALRAPMPLVEARHGWRVTLTAPAPAVSAHVWTMESARLAGEVPLARVTGTMSVYSMPMRAALVAPMIVAGPYGRAALVAPMALVTGTFALPATFEAWVMNVRNGGMTRWTNFPFTQFARVGNATYALGNGNLYLLGGDTDGGTTPISWSFETGLNDLGSPGVKHIPYLYLDGIIDGVVEIVVLDDRGREFAYEYDTKQRGAVHLPHRRKLGNGIRTRSVGFRLRSTTGAYIELDSLEPEATVTQRSI